MAKVLTFTLNPALDLTVQLPQLQLGIVNRSVEQHLHPAGKGLNVARVLTDLGHTLTVAGFLGMDNHEAFDGLFARRKWRDGFVRVPGQTRCNVKIAEADGRVTDVNGPGMQVDAGAQQALFASLDALMADQDLVVVAGSLPPGVAPDWFAGFVAALHDYGKPVLLDSSGAALRAGITARPALIKPNINELSEYAGRPLAALADLAAEAERLHGLGVEHVVVSMGSDGVCWFGPGMALRATSPKVPMVSTVGAGDSLLAGMAHGLLSGWPPERSLRLAAAVGALAVTQLGAGVPDVAKLEPLQQAVTIHAVQEDGQ
ncbi:1-phosphofructokinase [Verticiella sediminum]|uniref:Phosphofructokinase n=1 Tax=Verticiella sediminum TaxID=1247510 RepID=A0A556AG97_9BURK|nr:1-phosphofructokinase [Verticiella sediminum]TSH91909.1 1-phosphofructokinase [Verticiella sediminum]